MTDPESSAPVGETVGSYRVLCALGHGGMGVVYKAQDEKLNRLVALKVIRPDLMGFGAIQQRFLQEARAASALDHPNIGTIYGIEEADGRMYIVMAYYEGETVAQKIQRGPLPPAESIDIAVQMARGLADAHDHNIVHRDIKPSNVIVNANGLAKIVDFGLARVVQSASETQTAGFTGTAAYMSPEQATGRLVDHRTDIWALGVVLWEMLTGEMPFRGENVPALLFQIVNQAPSETPGAIPGALRPILYRALAKEPEQRYASAKDIRTDLEAIQTKAPAPSPARNRRELRRAIESATGKSVAPAPRWRTVAGLVAAIVVALAGLSWYLLQSRDALGAKHIAVLPLENIGNNPQNQALADGLQESLTNRLSNLETGNSALWVVPSSELRRRKIADPAEAHRVLGANLVVTGSFQRDASGLHLSLHLVDPANMRQVGGQVLDDRTGDLAELQERAIASLSKWMKISPPAAAREAAAAARPAAYESYLKARGYMQRYDKPGNLDGAIAEYQAAVKTDPAFALGWAGLGEAYLAKFHVEQIPRWLDEAIASCTRAAQIDSSLAPVHVALGRMQADTGKLDLAVQEFQRALDLNPRNSDALAGLASVYERQGRFPEAEKTYQRAIALRADYWEGYNRLADFYLRQKRPAEAEAQLKRAIELTPDNWVGYVNLGVALINQNKYDASAQAFEKSIQLAPSYAAYVNLSNVYYRQMKPAQAAPLLEKALALNDADYRAWFNYALANRWLAIKGDKAAGEKARSAYQRALKILPRRGNLWVTASVSEPSQ